MSLGLAPQRAAKENDIGIFKSKRLEIGISLFHANTCVFRFIQFGWEIIEVRQNKNPKNKNPTKCLLLEVYIRQCNEVCVCVWYYDLSQDKELIQPFQESLPRGPCGCKVHFQFDGSMLLSDPSPMIRQSHPLVALGASQ
jgi:hypothetical protein